MVKDMGRTNLWDGRRKPNPHASVRLFCFPYAGGAASIFRAWGDSLPDFVETYPVQLPGRGPRSAEAQITRLPELLQALADALGPHLDKPFAFFGHSMGALLSLELARLLRKQSGVEPAHMFLSGCRALQIPDPHPPTHDLPEPEFIEVLRRLNGTPKEVFENPELLGFILPLLRADFKLCQTYRYADDLPLGCPLTVFGGTEDQTTREQLEAWREQTRASFSLKMFPGDHFFLHAAEREILEIIAAQLAATLRRPERGRPQAAGLRPCAVNS